MCNSLPLLLLFPDLLWGHLSLPYQPAVSMLGTVDTRPEVDSPGRIHSTS